MQIKEGIVLKRISISTYLIKVDNEEIIGVMDAILVMNYYQVIVGDKIYVKGRVYIKGELRGKIIGPTRESMSYDLQWTSNHSPISPKQYERRFKEEEDSSL